MTNKHTHESGLEMLDGVALSDLSAYDVDAGLRRFTDTLAADGLAETATTTSTTQPWSKLLGWGGVAVLTGLALGVGWAGSPDSLPPDRIPSDDGLPVELAIEVPISAAGGTAQSAAPMQLLPAQTLAAAKADPSEHPAESEGARKTALSSKPKLKAKAKANKARTPDGPKQDPDAEIRMAAQMRLALGDSPREALELARSGQRQFPEGMFVKERRAHEVLALDALGRASEAQARAQSFLQDYPSGPQSERVRRIFGAAN
jgi:hypothetical protein